MMGLHEGGIVLPDRIFEDFEELLVEADLTCPCERVDQDPDVGHEWPGAGISSRFFLCGLSLLQQNLPVNLTLLDHSCPPRQRHKPNRIRFPHRGR